MGPIAAFFALAVVPALATWIYAWMAWTGRRRKWVKKRPSFGPPPIMSWHKRNYWPLLQGVIGAAWLSTWTFIAVDELLSGQWGLHSVLFLAICTVTIILCCWWPEAWRPQWHKDWVARGGDRDRTGTPLFSDDELIACGELPPGAAEKIRRQQARAARKKRR